MEWIKIEDVELFLMEEILFMEVERSKKTGKLIKTEHYGWLDEVNLFYSEVTQGFIPRAVVKYICKIPNINIDEGQI